MADAFYEWRKRGRTEDPVLHPPSVRPALGFAGIWSAKRGEVGNCLVTCAIVTCPPNEPVAKIHDRMPVILIQDPRNDPVPMLTEIELAVAASRCADSTSSHHRAAATTFPSASFMICLSSVKVGHDLLQLAILLPELTQLSYLGNPEIRLISRRGSTS